MGLISPAAHALFSSATIVHPCQSWNFGYRQKANMDDGIEVTSLGERSDGHAGSIRLRCAADTLLVQSKHSTPFHSWP